MQVTTVGALARPTTPFPNTLRPMGTMLPPPITEPGSIFQHRTSPTGVVRAIILSYQMDKFLDQPYKPEADTTLAEAHLHLERQGYILIHGGKITNFVGMYTLLMWEDGIQYPINYDEVVELLFCNYPDVRLWEPEPDTTPCVAPKPELVPGMGMWCQECYGTDIDTIAPTQWQPITFPVGIHHQVLYVGDLEIGDRPADVWWSVPLGCFLAQHLPQ